MHFSHHARTVLFKMYVTFASIQIRIVLVICPPVPIAFGIEELSSVHKIKMGLKAPFIISLLLLPSRGRFGRTQHTHRKVLRQSVPYGDLLHT